MAFGVEAVGGGAEGDAAASPLTISFTVTAANLLLAGIGVGRTGGDPALITGITYNGDALSRVSGSAVGDGNWEGAEWWRLDNPDTGTHDLVVSWGAEADEQVFAAIISFTEANLTLKTPSTNGANSANPNVTVADTASGDIVVSTCSCDGSSSATTQAGSLIFESENLATDSDFNAQYQTATAANTACTWTNATSDNWVASGLAVASGAAGGQTVAIGLNTETDSALAMAHAKSKALGLNTETDSVLTMTRVKTKAIGLNTEADATFAMTHSKAKAIGLNTETDSAFQILRAGTVHPIGLCDETDAAFALGKSKLKAIGLNSETDSVFAFVKAKARALGLVNETDSAFSFSKLKRKLIGLATEFDSALGITSNAADVARRAWRRIRFGLGFGLP